jgi:uncharacterized membrane protein YfcA
VGSLPWQAMVYFTMWLQLLGFSDLAASSLMAVFALGTSAGHLIGGFIGAFLTSRASPLTLRMCFWSICVVQLCVATVVWR